MARGPPARAPAQAGGLIFRAPHGSAWHVALLAGAAALLYAAAVAFPRAPCWMLAPVVAALAWPIWRYQREYALFERRAVLAGVTREESALRAWLWAGRVTRVVQALTALGWATLLLALATRLEPWHWAVVALDALVLALLVRPVTYRLSSDVRREQLGIAARRWPLAWINLALLAAVFFAVDFFVVGAPDTRGLAWHEVAERTYGSVAAGAGCRVAGALAGGLAAVDALAWHAAQVLIPSLPSTGLKWAAWAVFLLQAGLFAIALTRLYLGVVAVFDREGLRPSTPPESSRDFVVTAVAAALLLLALAWALRDFDGARVAARARQAVAWMDPCRTDAEGLARLEASLASQFQALRVAEQQHVGERVDASLAPLFAEAEKNVDAYLDWYFTVIGEYQRLGALVTGRFAESMREELERRVFGDAFRERLERANAAIAAESQARLEKAGVEMGGKLQAAVDAKPCLLGRIDRAAMKSVERDATRASAAAFAGAAVAVTAGVMARRAAAAATTRAASKRAFQGAASLGGRVVAKRAGSTLVAAAGGAAVCGPLAPLCALIAGGVTWITLDKAFIEIDELRFREEMKAEILESLRLQRSELAAELRVPHEAAIDQAVAGMQQSVRRAFVPAREGLAAGTRPSA